MWFSLLTYHIELISDLSNLENSHISKFFFAILDNANNLFSHYLQVLITCLTLFIAVLFLVKVCQIGMKTTSWHKWWLSLSRSTWTALRSRPYPSLPLQVLPGHSRPVWWGTVTPKVHSIWNNNMITPRVPRRPTPSQVSSCQTRLRKEVIVQHHYRQTPANTGRQWIMMFYGCLLVTINSNA